MRIKCSARFSLCEKIFTRKKVIPLTWIRKEMVFYSRIQTTRTMGQSCGANDDKIWRKQTPSLPIHESIVPRSAQKQRWWKTINTLLYRWDTIETVFRTIVSVHQLSIYRAVSNLCEECKTCHVRTERLVLAGQSNPLFAPSVMKTHILLTDDPAQVDLLQKYQERVGRLPQQNRVSQFLLMQDS